MGLFDKIEQDKFDQLLIEYRDEMSWRSNLKYLRNILLLSIGLYVIEYLNRGVYSWQGFLAVFYYTLFCWYGSSYLGVVCLYLFSRMDQTGKRIISYLGMIIVYVFIITAIGYIILEDQESVLFFELYFSSLLITLLISATYLASDYFKLYKKNIAETERLKRVQMEKELKILNSQVNPHFLFNSLNTLMAIIPEEAKNALQFTESFSKVYRYTLLHKEHEVVTVTEELQLVEDYCFLLKIRFGDNFNCTSDIPREYQEAVIPPFVLQLLVENATKHNAVGDESPLEIRIFMQDDQLVVQNNLNPRVSEAEGTKTGLQNIQKRVEHLTGKSIEVIKDQHYYKVAIPLTFAVDYESTDH